jgi:hypothetical protein
MEELSRLKEIQKTLLSVKVLDLKAINEVNNKLYQIRQARAMQRAREKAQAQEKRQAEKINAIFER